MLTVDYVTQVSRASDRDVIYIHYFNNPHNFSAGKVSSNYFSDFSDSETKAKGKKSLQVPLNRSQVLFLTLGTFFVSEDNYNTVNFHFKWKKIMTNSGEIFWVTTKL